MFAVWILLALLCGSCLAESHQHHQETSSSGNSNEQNSLFIEFKDFKYNLSWCVDYDEQTVIFEAKFEQVPEKDRFIMIGFSDHGDKGRQAGSDFCLYNGTAFVDGYLADDLSVKYDIQQDCQYIEGDYSSKHLVFKRKFSTCDVRDYAFEPGTTQFLMATGRGKFESLRDASHHFYRYNMLLQYPVVFPEIGPDSKTLNITADNAHIPTNVTTYWCAIVELDDDLKKDKHHIIRMDPIITPGNERFVHHMEVYHCAGESDYQQPYNGNCMSEERPKMSHLCSKVLAAWAMGASTLFYPKEAGLPFGGPEWKSYYVMVEIHYNNPEQIGGHIDNSGFQFTYTKNLRPNDAGIMELGLIYSDVNSIPPGQAAYPLTGYCNADCTQNFPDGGITIFGTQLHAHETGRKLWTSHFRNGVKIGEINRDNHYSHHWQHIVALQKQVTVLPGDVLATTCVYDTRDKKDFVFGGYEISNEMCVNYIYYYPISEIEVCKSAVDNSTLDKWFNDHGVDGELVHEKYSKLLKPKMKKEMPLELLELYSSGDLNMHCLNHTGQLIPGKEWEHVKHPFNSLFSGVYQKTRSQQECPAIND